MKLDLSKISYQFQNDTISVQNGSEILELKIKDISKVRFFSKNALNKLSGNLYLDIYTDKDENASSVTFYAVHKKLFRGQFKEAEGEGKWCEIASKLLVELNKLDSPPEILVGRFATLWFNRVLFGSLIATVILVPVFVFTAWYLDLANIEKPWMVLPGCFALIIIMLRAKDELFRTFRSRKFNVRKLCFSEIRSLM
ncbi:MAG: hypothetical protein JKY94_08375 [Rhodobacteraceae bacterium]|nr:hypothetical protein [Paracoccaceae bacterium]